VLGDELAELPARLPPVIEQHRPQPRASRDSVCVGARADHPWRAYAEASARRTTDPAARNGKLLLRAFRPIYAMIHGHIFNQGDPVAKGQVKNNKSNKTKLSIKEKQKKKKEKQAKK
jgi:hypothetical protein